MPDLPAKEREVALWDNGAIDGTPAIYIAAMMALILALCFIPFSTIMASGGSFPMAEGILPLAGWLLGPIGGAIAAGVGRLIGIFAAPDTAGFAFTSVLSAFVAAFSAGLMDDQDKRKSWRLALTAYLCLCFLLFAGRAVVINGISFWAAFAGSFLDWSGIVLFVLPTRTLAAKWLKSPNLGLVAAGLFLGTWMCAGLLHVSSAVITYWVFNWPEDVWVMLIPIIPMENFFRCVIGTVIGTGVIAGLRAAGLAKPHYAIY